jgi:hypothetical protein
LLIRIGADRRVAEGVGDPLRIRGGDGHRQLKRLVLVVADANQQCLAVLE